LLTALHLRTRTNRRVPAQGHADNSGHLGAERCGVIHCRLGLDRSALLTGIVLVRDGRRPEDAVRIMRERRSPYVLINQTFERYLLSLDQRDLSAHSSSASRSMRSSRS
jgi:hypothetical protein